MVKDYDKDTDDSADTNEEQIVLDNCAKILYSFSKKGLIAPTSVKAIGNFRIFEEISVEPAIAKEISNEAADLATSYLTRRVVSATGSIITVTKLL